MRVLKTRTCEEYVTSEFPPSLLHSVSIGWTPEMAEAPDPLRPLQQSTLDDEHSGKAKRKSYTRETKLNRGMEPPVHSVS